MNESPGKQALLLQSFGSCSFAGPEESVAGLPGLVENLHAAGLSPRALAAASQVVLFGSRAAQVHQERSDFDLLCVGDGSTRITASVDIVWVSEERLEQAQWLGSELANHVACYGKLLWGSASWASKTFCSQRAIDRKLAQIEERVEAVALRWTEMLPVYQRKYHRLVRRDLQRLLALSKDEPVPPTPILDRAWNESPDSQELASWARGQLDSPILPPSLLDRISRLLV